MVVQDYVRKFARITDRYCADKIYDVKDVGRRILENMTALKDHHDNARDASSLPANFFPPTRLSFIRRKQRHHPLSGGLLSHVAILARSPNIPLVVADAPGLQAMPSGAKILLDGVMGTSTSIPAETTIKKVMDREDLNKNIDRLKLLIANTPPPRSGWRSN